jgi:hypothetical protein
MVVPYEFSYNSLVLGPTHTHRIREIEGLGPAPIKSRELARDGADGAWFYARFLAARHLFFHGITVSTRTGIDSAMDAWEVAFAPRADDLPLTFRRGGDGSDKTIYCRVKDRAYTVDPLYAEGFADWLVELVAEDPNIV